MKCIIYLDYHMFPRRIPNSAYLSVSYDRKTGHSVIIFMYGYELFEGKISK